MAGCAISAGLSSVKCWSMNSAGGRVNPRIGDLRALVVELGVEVEAAEAARELEVLANVSVGPLDLAVIRHVLGCAPGIGRSL